MEATDFTIELGGLDDPRVIGILSAHLELMRSQSPPESTHALDIEGLRNPSISFWTARLAGKPVGCVALKRLDDTLGELKSMHTVSTARGRGIARALLKTVETAAIEQGLTRLSLETGTPEGFEPARLFYTKSGYEICGPFADYTEDPFSVFMTKALL